MRKFDVPDQYKSNRIAQLKELRKQQDPRKKDFSPSRLDFGPLQVLIPRHFGFCYGVENAIEIAYKTLDKHPNESIYFLSEMIHNPVVNDDLKKRGIQFLQNTKGEELIPIDGLSKDSIVLIPAFGTSLEMKARLKGMGIALEEYDTTCPFVVKVWNKAEKISKDGFSVIVHGKPEHEETRATFSHSANASPTLVLRNMEEAEALAAFMKGELAEETFYQTFDGQMSKGFRLKKDLIKFGVVNQTTMLASETQGIALYLRSVLVDIYGEENIKQHFADTRDTLCYATNDNQSANIRMLEEEADLAIIVGGYNSSNTSHLLELAEEKLPSYFVSGAECIRADRSIQHFDLANKRERTTADFMQKSSPLKVMLTSGASCPDTVVEEVLMKLLSFFPAAEDYDTVVQSYKSSLL